MLVRRPFQVLVLVLCAAKGICTDGGLKPSPSQELNQADWEIILGAQTTLRRYLIQSLANLLEAAVGFHPFDSGVRGALEGLRSRDLDPLKSLWNGYSLGSNQSIAYQLATVMHSLQGCSPAQKTFAGWHSFLQTIPYIDDIVPSQPIITHLTLHHLHKANAAKLPYAELVLLQIRRNRLKLTSRLLGDVLYNYRFRNHYPDLDSALQSTIRMLAATHTSLHTFRPSPKSGQGPNQILSDILRFLFRHSHSRLTFETAELLSALSHLDNVNRFKGASSPWELLDLIRHDDYPPDVVGAAADLASAIRYNQVEIDAEGLRGYSPLEKILKLIGQLATVPSGNPLSRKVHAIYPHVKLRYLSSKGQFFRPRTSSDVAFLLNSFLTVPSPLLIKEVHQVFLVKEFEWQKALENFDFSRFSKPRSLLMAMLEELLRNSEKLPACDLILFNYFLGNYSQVPACSAHESSDDAVGDSLRGPITPLSMTPDMQITSSPHTAPTAEATAAECSEGPPVELVDPDSIIEIFNSSHHSTFLSDLIRYNPMPADRYPNKTRVAVYREVMNDLKTSKYIHSWTAYLIQQALARTPLNEKANLPPIYFRLCSFEAPAAVPHSAGNCLPHEILTPVYDLESVFEALVGSAPDASTIRHRANTYRIPFDPKNPHTKSQLLEIILNAMAADATEHDVLADIHALKSRIVRGGWQVPRVVPACLPQSVSPPRDECQPNQTPVPVLNANTIFDALGPDAPTAPYVRARIRELIILTDIRRHLTKGDVLRDVLTQLETVEDSSVRPVIIELRNSILRSGPAIEKPDIIHACMSDPAVQFARETPVTPTGPHLPTVMPFTTSATAFATASSLPTFAASTTPNPSSLLFYSVATEDTNGFSSSTPPGTSSTTSPSFPLFPISITYAAAPQQPHTTSSTDPMSSSSSSELRPSHLPGTASTSDSSPYTSPPP